MGGALRPECRTPSSSVALPVGIRVDGERECVCGIRGDGEREREIRVHGLSHIRVGCSAASRASARGPRLAGLEETRHGGRSAAWLVHDQLRPSSPVASPGWRGRGNGRRGSRTRRRHRGCTLVRFVNLLEIRASVTPPGAGAAGLMDRLVARGAVPGRALRWVTVLTQVLARRARSSVRTCVLA